MAHIKIYGTPKLVRREELRCIISAASIVMEHHGHLLSDGHKTILVNVRERLKGDNSGTAYRNRAKIDIKQNLPWDDMITVAIHETIHLYMEFQPGTVEKCTSTLTGKLKPSIMKIYNALLQDNYSRAAFIAHTKIAYPTKPGQKDFYDKAEWAKVEGERFKPKEG